MKPFRAWVGAAAVLALVAGACSGSKPQATQTASARPASPATISPSSSAGSSSGSAGSLEGATPGNAQTKPFAGLLLIANRGKNGLLVVNADKQVIWRYPSKKLPQPPGSFYFPDDAFWVEGGNAILMNEEENHVLLEIAYPSGKVLWTYGHPGVSGSKPGYLNQPDDVYPYPSGGFVVADASNCRILFISDNGKPTSQIGTTSSPGDSPACVHGLPKYVGYPNGDTPLANGNLLLSELHYGWIDEVKPDGTPIWQLQVKDLRKPSDPQPTPDGNFIAVDYQTPGHVVEFDNTGKVIWEFGANSGKNELHNPSIGAMLPNGLVALSDDYGNRIIFVDPSTNKIVWEYGTQGLSGRDALNLPDGFDLLLPDGSIPMHVDFPAK
jgi:outer membrane protein assembly factor BamB